MRKGLKKLLIMGFWDPFSPRHFKALLNCREVKDQTFCLLSKGQELLSNPKDPRRKEFIS